MYIVRSARLLLYSFQFSPNSAEAKILVRNTPLSNMGVSNSQLLPVHAAIGHAFVVITPFETGRMVTEAANLVRDARGPSMATSWRFFITHPKKNTNLWFDMGISHVKHVPICTSFSLD